MFIIYMKMVVGQKMVQVMSTDSNITLKGLVENYAGL